MLFQIPRPFSVCVVVAEPRRPLPARTPHARPSSPACHSRQPSTLRRPVAWVPSRQPAGPPEARGLPGADAADEVRDLGEAVAANHARADRGAVAARAVHHNPPGHRARRGLGVASVTLELERELLRHEVIAMLVPVAGRRDLDDGDGHGVDVDPVQAPRGMAVCNEAAQRVLEIGRVRNRDAAQVARPCVLDSGCTSGASPSPPSRATSSPPLVRDPRCRTELPQYATRLRCAPRLPWPDCR
jgi:hypothetical protein